MPRDNRIPGLLLVLGFSSLKPLAPTMTATTKTACPTIHKINCRLWRSASSWSRLWAGSPMAPKTAMSTAPAQTSIVPPNDHSVKGSPSIRVAQMELKTSPDCAVSAVRVKLSNRRAGRRHTACSVDRTGRGRVVICIVLPSRFETMNISIPSCYAVSHVLLVHNRCYHPTPAIFVVYVEAGEHHVDSSRLPGYETCAAKSSPGSGHLLTRALLWPRPVSERASVPFLMLQSARISCGKLDQAYSYASKGRQVPE